MPRRQCQYNMRKREGRDPLAERGLCWQILSALNVLREPDCACTSFDLCSRKRSGWDCLWSCWLVALDGCGRCPSWAHQLFKLPCRCSYRRYGQGRWFGEGLGEGRQDGVGGVSCCREAAVARNLHELFAMHSMSGHETERVSWKTSYATQRWWCRVTLLAKSLSGNSEQRGLSRVIALFVGFDGDEFYFQPVQRARGLTFGQGRKAFLTLWRWASGSQVSPPLVPDMDLVLDADDVLILLAEDRSRAAHAHARQCPESANRRTLAKVVESSCQRTAEDSHRRMEWSHRCRARGGGRVLWVQVRRCGFTRRCPRTTERSFSKATCAVDRRPCRIWQSITGKSLWEVDFCWKICPSKRRAKFRFSQTPMRQSSAMRDDVVSWLAVVSETHTRELWQWCAPSAVLGRVGPSLFCPRRVFLPLLLFMKPRITGQWLGNGGSKACPTRILPLLLFIAASEGYDWAVGKEGL